MPAPSDAVVNNTAAQTTPPFAARHLGSSGADVDAMLQQIGVPSLDKLVDEAVPNAIRRDLQMGLPQPASESDALAELGQIAGSNVISRSMIGMGYHRCHTPSVLLRNIIENPRWYTPYTPYQAEIAQGRLEALLNFQTMVCDLTGLPVANASMLDEATAGAEAMAMCHAQARGRKPAFIVADHCHPQTISVCQTRGESMGIDVVVADVASLDAESIERASGVLIQYPDTRGNVGQWQSLCQQVHDAGGLVVAAADPLALVLLPGPGNWADDESQCVDIAVGSTQRFGLPMGYGGPHAAYLACRDKLVRKMPGRLVGVSRDSQGNPAFRLSIQTREQHIKRDRATSNICTAQVLLAVVAGMYACWHGPKGLEKIARHVHSQAARLRAGLSKLGLATAAGPIFDTVCVTVDDSDAVLKAANSRNITLRKIDATTVAASCDEMTDDALVADALAAFAEAAGKSPASAVADGDVKSQLPTRSDAIFTHPVFHLYQTEHEMLRYLNRLADKDVSLCQSMIPLGSCTMKLNAAAEMLPITWPGFAHVHPYAPAEHAKGYSKLAEDLCDWLGRITGLPAVSLQPNAGSQGEYAGLLAIARFHQANNQPQRDVCLIPTSAHGTNPASAVIAGMRVVPIACNERGDIDLDDLAAKAKEHEDCLAALMITYPSTHGVFEVKVQQICKIVHDHGGQVYLDGANMNAQVGLTSPAEIGADVCHLNLHKTFCIPHGGGGPGMGPIAAAAHLADFLPGNPADADSFAVSAADLGSPMILPISWMYIRMMGDAGLTDATRIAILNANYMASRLSDQFDILYVGDQGRVAHEFIIDARPFDKAAHVTVEDIAKRLMDFGFHAPTMSWPVAGTLMIEPTESESKAELDRFCDAMIAIRSEITQVESDALDANDNPLKNAPHTAAMVTADEWSHPYPRSQAAYPDEHLRQHKHWPAVGRIDNPYGDRNLVCTCPPMAELCEA